MRNSTLIGPRLWRLLQNAPTREVALRALAATLSGHAAVACRRFASDRSEFEIELQATLLQQGYLLEPNSTPSPDLPALAGTRGVRRCSGLEVFAAHEYEELLSEALPGSVADTLERQLDRTLATLDFLRRLDVLRCDEAFARAQAPAKGHLSSSRAESDARRSTPGIAESRSAASALDAAPPPETAPPLVTACS